MEHLQQTAGPEGPEEYPELMLCQDCLATAKFTLQGHLGETRCGCGGEYCGCPGCADQAHRIRQQNEQRGAQKNLFDDREHEWVCHPTRGWHLALKTKGTNHA